jgi:hypothetical protein
MIGGLGLGLGLGYESTGRFWDMQWEKTYVDGVRVRVRVW